MYYYIVSAGVDVFTAGVKAPKDMCEIMSGRGYTPIPLYEYRRGGMTLQARLRKLLSWASLAWKIKKGSAVVLQYPYSMTTMAEPFIKMLQRMKRVKFIFLLHDIDSIRAYNMNRADRRERILPEIDYLICHNAAMKSYLTEKGIDSARIFSLGIFDYMHDCALPELFAKERDQRKVIIAGNLNSRKSPYLDKLLRSDRKYTLNLFGPGFESKAEYSNYEYFGQLDPDELPAKLEGGLGLVWDGDSMDTCDGATGQYLRYNNPHKVSLYISSCIPVVVWSQSAVADYVRDKRLGFTIDSLAELNDLVANLDDKEYEAVKENVRSEAEKLTQGWYLNRVLDQIEASVNQGGQARV